MHWSRQNVYCYLSVAIIAVIVCTMALGCKLIFPQRKPSDPNSATQAKSIIPPETLAKQQQQIEQLTKQLDTLRSFGPDRLKHVIHVQNIEFGRFTDPYDDNNDGYDEGLKVYLVVKDTQGDIIKAAGSVTIELFDLADESKRIAKYDFPLEKFNKHWLPGFMADHYLFKLPWQQRPKHNDLTIQLNYKDALTGLTFKIQKMIAVTANKND